MDKLNLVKIFKQIIDEYRKSLLALFVQAVSIVTIYEWLVQYFYTKNYILPRSLVVVVLLLALWGSIRYVRLHKKLKSYEHPKLTKDQEYVLWLHKDLPRGNGQCATTLCEGQDKVHPQEAQYYLDTLNNLGFIELINDPEIDDEPLYRLTVVGRKYLVENIILNQKWNS